MFTIHITETGLPTAQITTDTIEEAVFELNNELTAFLRRNHIRPELGDTNYAYALDTDETPYAYYTSDRVFFHGQIRKIQALSA